jgi:hypothetical protein
MEREEIVQAYQPFIETLRAGGFVDPENGWDAAQVAAHIVANNNGIAAVAEAIAVGERPSYDNTEVIDDAQLRDMASAAGGPERLAELVETSAGRLARALASLGPDAAAVEVPSRIVDGGRVVRDGPIPVGALIEVNATIHLQIHLDQLRALLA